MRKLLEDQLIQDRAPLFRIALVDRHFQVGLLIDALRLLLSVETAADLVPNRHRADSRVVLPLSPNQWLEDPLVRCWDNDMREVAEELLIHVTESSLFDPCPYIQYSDVLAEIVQYVIELDHLLGTLQQRVHGLRLVSLRVNEHCYRAKHVV